MTLRVLLHFFARKNQDLFPWKAVEIRFEESEVFAERENGHLDNSSVCDLGELFKNVFFKVFAEAGRTPRIKIGGLAFIAAADPPQKPLGVFLAIFAIHVPGGVRP